MSKELTEQWRNGALPLNHYYIERKSGRVFIDNTVLCFDERIPFSRLRWEEDIKEVLAPVPSYDEYKRLQEQLKEANEVIKWYDGLENILIGWEMIAGQPKGTAKEYLDKWGVK